MSDKFLDTNILIYTVGNELDKKQTAVELIEEKAIISTQVLSESINVMHRKLKFDLEKIESIIQMVIGNLSVTVILPNIINLALKITKKYQYSYYDSQIIASALENNCHILYSEDMQHNQIINNQLKIINPFL